MAREKMVTRTMQTTCADVLCVNTATDNTEIVSFTLAGTFKSDKDIIKAVEPIAADMKPVLVKDTHVEETLYGMTEQKFMENAEVLPARKKTETD